METWNKRLGGVRPLLRSIMVWLCTALILLTTASFLLTRAESGSDVLGYVSSGISFLCASAAGFSLADSKGGSPMARSLVLALSLLILLLTLGFLIGDKQLEPSGVLSVVTFTISGVLFGSVVMGKIRPGRKKQRKTISVRHSG